MSLVRVTKDNRCICCGAQQQVCIVCEQPFHSRNEEHVICSDRCRKRKSRRRALEGLPHYDDLFKPKEDTPEDTDMPIG